MDEERIGFVEHYYPKAHAAAVRLDGGDLHIGDTIHVVGNGVDLVEIVSSLELQNRPIKAAHEGETVGILVKMPVREKADVFIVKNEPGLA